MKLHVTVPVKVMWYLQRWDRWVFYVVVGGVTGMQLALVFTSPNCRWEHGITAIWGVNTFMWFAMYCKMKAMYQAKRAELQAFKDLRTGGWTTG